jgi:hypothetical protein
MFLFRRNTMKLRWWVLGAVAVAGGIFALKHFTESKNNNVDFVDNGNQNYYDKLSADISEADYQEIDFSA